MANIKGPAIPEDTFDMTGHCCGARYTGIKNLTEQGFRFELTEEARAYLREQGIEVPASQTPSPGETPQTEPIEQPAPDSQVPEPGSGLASRPLNARGKT